MAVLLGAAFRLVLAFAPPVGGNALRLPDSVGYDYAAKSLLEWGELWCDEVQRAKREPGYPLFMAGVYAVFGRSPVAVRAVQAVLGALVCVPVYVLARRLGGRRAGRIAAAVAALDPYLAVISVLVLTEGIYTPLLWAAVAAVTAGIGCQVSGAGERPDSRPPASDIRQPTCGTRLWWAAVSSAVFWGALVSIRTEALPVFVGVAVVMLVAGRSRRAAAGRLVAALVGLTLVSGLWAWRNQRVVGHPVFTTLNVGETLYDSLWARADGRSDKDAFMKDFRGLDWWARMDQYEKDRYLRRAALRYAWENPWRTARLAAVKFGRTWSPWPNAEQYSGPVSDALLSAAFVLVMVLGFLGMWRERRRWRTWAVWLAPVLVVAAAHLVIVGSVRYRVPVMPFFVVMVGVAFGARRRPGHVGV